MLLGVDYVSVEISLTKEKSGKDDFQWLAAVDISRKESIETDYLLTNMFVYLSWAISTNKS